MPTATDLRPATTAPKAPARFRAYGPKGLKAAAVDREKRVITGYAVITRGEALGHGLWIDSEMLDQVVTHGNAAPKGIKSRFTHPGLCSDGLGKYLGRARNFRREGDVVRADLHFSPVTAKAPEFNQDPAEYIMDLAEKDPQAFATSIVYYPDRGAESRHQADHTDEDGDFISPDKDNTRDLPHARLASLEASDLVDEPAANPGGFFSQSEETAVVAEQFLSWILGESDVAPGPEAMGGGDPNRIREFFYGFLDRHGLEVAPKRAAEAQEATMADQSTPPTGDPMQAAREQFAANLKALREAFPKDESFAVQCAADGLTVEQAKARYCDVLAGKLAAAEVQLAERDKTLAALQAENAGIKQQLLAGAAPVP
ncbi:MAG TPA: hypothetical protein PKZ08_07115, partial [Vicinamibacterales bacterium]|nr:hypothetical protein [Vicinamibacterales bacterium]